MRLLGLSGLLLLGSEANALPPDSLGMARKLATAMIDLPDPATIPGFDKDMARGWKGSQPLINDLKARNPGKEKIVDEEFQRLVPTFFDATRACWREEAAKRLAALMTPDDLTAAVEFSEQPEGHHFFDSMNSAFQGKKVDLIKIASETAFFRTESGGAFLQAFGQAFGSKSGYQSACDRLPDDVAEKLRKRLQSEGLDVAHLDQAELVTGKRSATKGRALTEPELRRLADKGNLEAAQFVGQMNYLGDGIPVNYTVALTYFMKAAQAGNSDAQYNVGVMFTKGRGVPRDPAQAVHWYQKAAEQGQSRAQLELGRAYINGVGIEQNLITGLDWCRKAAEAGLLAAELTAADMYYRGEGTQRDLAASLMWYEKAAGQGSADAQTRAGKMYFNGEGAPKSLQRANQLFQQAAEQGYPEAQFALGLAYHDGSGVGHSNAESLRWYESAANQSFVPAQYNLGFAFMRGEGAPQNLPEAYKWFDLVASSGLSEPFVQTAGQNLDLLKAHMTTAQITQAKKLLTEWHTTYDGRRQ
jgi:TPR repeat protein